MKVGIMAIAELRTAIGVVNINDDANVADFPFTAAFPLLRRRGNPARPSEAATIAPALNAASPAERSGATGRERGRQPWR